MFSRWGSEQPNLPLDLTCRYACVIILQQTEVIAGHRNYRQVCAEMASPTEVWVNSHSPSPDRLGRSK